MKTKEAQSIFNFKQGDVICQIERAPFKQPEYNDNLGIETMVTRHTDGSYYGEPLEYRGIVNNQIVLQTIQDRPLGLQRRGEMILLPIDQWGEIWAKYEDPKNLLRTI